MRIHTDQCMSNFYNARTLVGVRFERFTHHASRSRKQAFDVVLSGSNSRRINSPEFGHLNAATWDEWGLFLHRLYLGDTEMIAGQYTDLGEFNFRTGRRFVTLLPRQQHRQHQWRLRYGEQHCACGAIRRF